MYVFLSFHEIYVTYGCYVVTFLVSGLLIHLLFLSTCICNFTNTIIIIISVNVLTNGFPRKIKLTIVEVKH